MPDKIPKKKRTFTISPDVFIKLKVFSSRKGIPYSIILEALANEYVSDTTRFPEIDFSKYK